MFKLLLLFTLQATSQRLSFGMTPKSRRLPKPGEMLLSVRGSPLGVFKEDNMEAIHGKPVEVLSSSSTITACLVITRNCYKIEL